MFYFVWETNSSIWIINSVTTSTVLINTKSKWIKKVSLKFISVSAGLALHG